MRWAEITIEAAELSVDAVTNILTDNSCAGTLINSTTIRNQWQADEIPLAPSDDLTHYVIGYLPVDDRLEGRLETISKQIKILPEFGFPLVSDEISVKWVEDDEWANEWKKYFKPLHVGNIVIKPSWEPYEANENDVVVELDPGMAFGTGGHPTTQLCLLALQKNIKGNEKILDVGTGSGILAIAAKMLGAKEIIGLDYDPIATKVAIENINRLGLENDIRVFTTETCDLFKEHADIVVANITANVILNMSKDLAEAVKPGGKLITSGIIKPRSQEVIDSLIRNGLVLVSEETDGEWVIVVLERPE